MAATLPAKLSAEFVGTFMLVFTVGCNVLAGSPSWAPLSIACTLMVMIYSFGMVSGGHLNPSVSFACGLAGKMSWNTVISYILVQIIAGLVAGFIYLGMFGKPVSLGPKAPFDWWEVMIVEALYTAMISFMVLSVGYSKRNNPQDNPNQFFALAIGFVVVSGGYAAGPISGASFNPAVSLGIDLTNYTGWVYQGFDLTNYTGWVYQGFLYTIYQLIGSVIAALCFRLTRPEDYKKSEERSYDPSLPTKLASEFLGTFMLVLTVGLNVLGKSVGTALSAAATLMCMIYALGDVSGGHFNPAVTLAVVLSMKGGCSVAQGFAYMAMQLIAGILAGFLFAGIYNVQTFPLAPNVPYRDFAACVVECIFTFVIAYVVLGTAVVKGIKTRLTRNYYYALAIGFSVAAGGNACGKVSGGVLNPAISFGIAVSHTLNHGKMYYCMIYSLIQMLGGLIAGAVFRITHAKEYSKKEVD